MGNKINCNFCGKSKKEAWAMFCGPNAYICDQCVELAVEIMDEKIAKSKRPNFDLDFSSPKDIHAMLDKFVINQDHAKKYLSVAVYLHYKRILNPKLNIKKQNILLAGPTGSGKTHIIKNLAKILGVPFVIGDANSLTQAGYVGEDVESLLTSLYNQADGDLDKAQQGIVVIDEIDKIASKNLNGASFTAEVSNQSVQQSLLKMIEGSEVNISQSLGRKRPYDSNIKFDTANVLFIFTGAFVGLEKVLEKRNKKIPKNRAKFNLDSEDLIAYGFIPEFVGRIANRILLNKLDKKDFVRILTEPEDSIINSYKKVFKTENAELTISNTVLNTIAGYALKQDCGARGLASVLESALVDKMYNFPYSKNTKVSLTKKDIDAVIKSRLSNPQNQAVA